MCEKVVNKKRMSSEHSNENGSDCWCDGCYLCGWNFVVSLKWNLLNDTENSTPTKEKGHLGVGSVAPGNDQRWSQRGLDQKCNSNLSYPWLSSKSQCGRKLSSRYAGRSPRVPLFRSQKLHHSLRDYYSYRHVPDFRDGRRRCRRKECSVGGI